jgi:hypothetical protein
MALSWSNLWIATYALAATPVYLFCFFSKGWFARQATTLRWIFANLAATAVGLAFGFLDHSHPRSPPEAYGIATAQCALFVTVALLLGWTRGAPQK